MTKWQAHVVHMAKHINVKHGGGALFGGGPWARTL